MERLTEPLHLNLISLLVLIFGSFRAKVAFDLVIRSQHAYSVLKIADEAKRLGLSSVSIVEFGVAAGAGLLNISKIAQRVTALTGVRFRIYGFDTGTGMPPPRDYRDHPDLYQEGDFPMNMDALAEALPKNVELVIGDLADTVPSFVKMISAQSPIGFVCIDVDYYWSAKDCLRILEGSPEKYLPRTLLYLDDIHLEPHNSWCGELLAVNEFNQEHQLRKIERYAFLRAERLFKDAPWIDHIFALHVLDHPARVTLRSRLGRATVVLENPYLNTRT